MKSNTYIYSTIILFSISFVFGIAGLNGQGTDVSMRKQKHLFIGLNAQPAKTEIVLNTDYQSIAGINSTGGKTFSGSLEIGYMFSRFFGLSSGLFFNNYSTTISLADYSDSYPAKDQDLENYRRIITGEEISEEQKISLLGVPVLLNLNIPFSRGFGLFIQSGVNLSTPISNSYESEGTFSYKGEYTQYNVIIEKAGVEGFVNDQKSNVNGTIEMKGFVMEFLASAGFNITFNDKFQILAGGFYNKPLTDMTEYTEGTSYYLSTQPDQINTLAQGSSNVSANAFGLKLGFRYFIK